MRASLSILLLSSAVITFSVPASSFRAWAETTPPLQYAKQGWTEDERQAFYTTSQGSHMIPYAWFKALQRLDVDEPFAGDQLQRYGYLPNEKSKLNPEGLPVGFVIDGTATTGELGMTCAACHTGQIEYVKNGVTQQLRIDGAPAAANFQLFLADLTAATRATLSDPARFDKFAHAALGSRYSSSRLDTLKSDFGDWVKQWGTFMDKSLPASPWGPGRLDAFGMIFNRVAAKDLGIDGNFKVADAPVSYPFLWNASRQDRTQWNGGVPNGLYINAIGRNAGEVFGVFADFAPRKQLLPPYHNYRNNSLNFTNLQAQEEKITSLRPPPWPFDIDQDLVDKGRVLFAELYQSPGAGREDHFVAPAALAVRHRSGPRRQGPRAVRGTLRQLPRGAAHPARGPVADQGRGRQDRSEDVPELAPHLRHRDSQRRTVAEPAGIEARRHRCDWRHSGDHGRRRVVR